MSKGYLCLLGTLCAVFFYSNDGVSQSFSLPIPGSAIAVESSTGVSNSANSIGASDNTGSLFAWNATAIYDLGFTLQPGDDLHVDVRRFFWTGQGQIETSVDGITFNRFVSLNSALQNSAISNSYESAGTTLVNEARYVRVTTTSGYTYVDAINYVSRSGDIDQDGIMNESDCAAYDASMGLDTDHDGVCDELDLDADNDGILNSLERNCNASAGASAESVEAEQSIGGGGIRAIGSDNSRANINNVNDLLILDMEVEAPGGTIFSLESRSNRSFHVLKIEGSLDGSEFSEEHFITNSALKQDEFNDFSFTSDVRYIRLTMSEDLGSGAIQIDDLQFAGFEICQQLDADNDGIEDYLDNDSDNDGCSDVVEAGFTDNDNNGTLDGSAIDLNGLVTGGLDGYSGTNSSVTTGAFGNCMAIGEVLYHAVNIDTDLSDVTPGDGLCADANGNCSLRAAIQEANSGSGFNVIEFSVAGTIEVSSPLPVITESVIIDGTTAPGYTDGVPSVSIQSSGFDLFHLSEADQSIIKGLNLSGSSVANFDGYAIILAHTEGVEIQNNVIHNRIRAIHANNSCDLDISHNDLRDSGAESWDGAVFINNLCPGSPNPLLTVHDNLYGAVNTAAVSAVQVLNSNGVVTSDGSIANSHIELTDMSEVTFPLRYVNVDGGTISNLNLSSTIEQGIGLRLLNSTSIAISDLTIGNKEVALQVSHGTGISVENSDFTTSGYDDDYAVILLENINAANQNDFWIRNIQFDSHAPTILNMVDCTGLRVSSDENSDPNIQINETLSGSSPIRIQHGTDIQLSGLSFVQEQSVLGSEAIMVESNSIGTLIEDCLIQGWASGLNLSSSIGTQLYCNTMAVNDNGFSLAGSSSIIGISDNAFRCNAVAINNHTSNMVVSDADYWGHPSGSASYNGHGDYFRGNVDASAWSSSSPVCASVIDSTLCSMEICNNGIDDDGDGVIDCADGSCHDSEFCMEELEGHFDDDELAIRSSEVQEGAQRIIEKLFPNPTDGPLHVQLGAFCEQIRLYDISGRELKRELNVYRGTIHWDFRELRPGSYILEALSGSQRETVMLIIK